jgi:hypothetical protein
MVIQCAVRALATGKPDRPSVTLLPRAASTAATRYKVLRGTATGGPHNTDRQYWIR